jgi:hypothetical protein
MTIGSIEERALCSRPPIATVVQQHHEASASLFGNRAALLTAPHARLHQLARLDERLLAHLDGLASAATDGSTTVQISGKEVMLKNKSYFKKSMGDEAGSAPKKGVVTSKQMGKVYFNAWSMDVKVEGENVVRMLDLTTHNHGSAPGNSPPWPYLDEVAFSSPKSPSNPCGDVAKKAQEKCGDCVVTTKGKNPEIKRKATNDAMCAKEDCKEALKCVLSPYRPSNCCGGEDGKKKTGHHVIPAHCFMPPGTRGAGGDARYAGCEGYSINDAPCICVDGEGKEKEHGRIHKRVDKAEDKFLVNGKAGSWTYAQASKAGSSAVAKVTKCDAACIQAQVDSYHQQKDGKTPSIANDTKLRADSSGNRSLSDSAPAPSEIKEVDML